MNHRNQIMLRLLILSLCLSICLSGCFGPVLPPIISPEAPVQTDASIATDLPNETTRPTETAIVPVTEPTVSSGNTTEPIPETSFNPFPIDTESEALIRWQNAGQRDYLPEERIDMVPFSEIEYVRPDVESLYADFDTLTMLAADSSDADALLEDYYGLYSRYISFYSMDTLANIRYSLDTTESYYKTEYDFCEQETPNVEEKLEALNKAFAASPARHDLEKKYFGEGYFVKFDDYEVYTNPEYLRLSKEEAALLNEYRELTSDIQVTYKEETKSLDEWLETDSYSVYIGALKAYYEQYNASVGDLYVRLVKLRRELAKALDYDSYAEYSYEVSYKRDYTPEQGTAFLDAIREHLVPVLQEASQDWSLSSLQYSDAETQSVMEMVNSAAEKIGGPVWDAFCFMRYYELCDIWKSAKKLDASFQTYIYDYEAPFVMVNAKGTQEDYCTFAHEFGHFADSYHNYGANEDLETAETFSQAMEFLALQYSDLLGPKTRSRLLRLKLYDLLQTFVYQGAYADFESRVYRLEPEELTVENVNELYRQSCKDYGIYEKSFDFYYSQAWIDVIHFFEVPYYIISYCVSAETALQVYELEANEEGAGVDAYFRLLDRDYESGVQKVMEDAELENPFQEEVIEQTAAFFQERLGLDES